MQILKRSLRYWKQHDCITLVPYKNVRSNVSHGMLCKRYKIFSFFPFTRLSTDCRRNWSFGSRQMTSNLQDFRLSLVGKDISPVQSAKDFGVILHPNLLFDDHLTTTVSECIARLAQISRVKHCLDKSSLLTVINALVFSN